MRAIVQRVLGATLKVNNEVVSEIKQGLLVFLGISCEDTEKEARYISDKLPKLRIFRDNNDKANLSVLDVDGEILIVSNFTLYAETKGTNRPSFSRAAGADVARPLYDLVVKLLKEKVPTKTGIFHEHMDIDIKADGPFTIVMDS